MAKDIQRYPMKKKKFVLEMTKQWQLYAMILLPIACLIIFRYVPMYFLIIAFKNYSVKKGVWGSAWVGFKHFKAFFSNPIFKTILSNTLEIGLYGYAMTMISALLLAFAMNEIHIGIVKRTAQMITYAPYFLSSVVLVGMIIQLFDYHVGPVNELVKLLGFEPIHFMAKPELFSSMAVWSDVWQKVGYSSVIYLAALSSVDPTLHEAAKMDGATRLQRLRHIDIPGISTTIAIMAILTSPNIIRVGYQKIYLMQNALNLSRSEILPTYIYKQGLQEGHYSYSTVAGLFNSLVCLFFILMSDRIAKWVSPGSGLF